MIIPDKKKIVSVMSAKLSPDGSSQDGGLFKDESGGDQGALKFIAQDLISAVRDNSVQGVIEALKAFMEEIKNADEEQDEKEV